MLVSHFTVKPPLSPPTDGVYKMEKIIKIVI